MDVSLSMNQGNGHKLVFLERMYFVHCLMELYPNELQDMNLPKYNLSTLVCVQ